MFVGRNADELRELTVEGTTFDPTTGGVKGLTSLDRNLEVDSSLFLQIISLCFLCMLCCALVCLAHWHGADGKVSVLDFCNKADVEGNGAQALSEVCAVCNDAHIEFKDGRYHAVGAPTEAALVVLVEKLGVADSGLKARIREQRAASPEGHADGTCQAYCRR